MPKTRELSKAEKFYIENNTDKTDTQLASVMPGIGPKTIQKFRGELPEKTDTDTTTNAMETPEERVNRLAKGPNSGVLMGRQPGIVVMTEAASEVADANRTVNGDKMTEKEYKDSNRDRIHTIDPNKPAR